MKKEQREITKSLNNISKKLKNKEKKTVNKPSKNRIKPENDENSSSLINRNKSREKEPIMQPKYSQFSTIEDTIKVDVKRTKKKTAKTKKDSKIAKRYMR